MATCPGNDIDVGSDCADVSGTDNSGYTIVHNNNPANDTGTIDCVCVYAVTGNNMSGIQYGSFS